MKKWLSTAVALVLLSSQAYGAIQDLDVPFFYPRVPYSISTTPTMTTSQNQINSATEDSSYYFTVPISGEIEGVSFRTATVGTGCTLDVRLETVDLATGQHSGTLADTSSNNTQVVDSTDDNTWFEVTFTATATVTKGDLLAVVFDVSSGTPVGLQLPMFSDDNIPTGLPYVVEDDGSPVVAAGAPIVAIKYQTIGYVPVVGTWPMDAVTTTTFNNTSTPDVIGSKFQLPYKCRVTGFWLWADMDGDAVVNLYDSDGVTVLASATMDKDIPMAASGAGVTTVYFTSSATLEANTDYWLAVEPSSSTDMGFYDYTIYSGLEGAAWAGDNFHFSSAKDPSGTGSWTTDTNRQPFIGVLIDGIDVSAGGGGGGGSYTFVS